MYGPLLSVLLVGMVPLWGMNDGTTALSHDIRIAPPAALQPRVAAELDARLTASGVIIVDGESGQALYVRNGDTARPMASLTKLMTALIIVENHALDEMVTIPRSVDDVVGNKARLPVGEQFSIGDLLSALLIMSANDAAVTLAEFHSGSTQAFVQAMNTRARELGLASTEYQNPSGLDAATQKSSPRDLAWLTMYVLRKEAIRERMSAPSRKISSVSGKSITLVHTHQLIAAQQSGSIVAGKTGTTDAAGQCLLSIVEAGGRTYITVLLHSKDRYADMRHMLASLTQ